MYCNPPPHQIRVPKDGSYLKYTTFKCKMKTLPSATKSMGYGYGV